MKTIFGPGGTLSQKLEKFESREGQVTMADAVFKTLENGGSLLVEAGTGTGKTIAYLVPAVMSGLKVVIATGTLNLQEQVIKNDIPIVEKIVPQKFKTACMKGRGNYLCRRRLKSFTQQPLFRESREGDFFYTLLKWADTTETGDRAEIENLPDDYSAWSEINSKSELCLGQACATFDICFITKMRKDAAEADIVVVNHHLFFADLNVKDSAFGEVIPRYDAVIFDEAHMVEETATNYFGQRISNYQIEEAARDTERELRAAKTKDRDIVTTLANLVRRSKIFFSSFKAGHADGRRRLTVKEAEKAAVSAEELANTLRFTSNAVSSMKKANESASALALRFLDMANVMEEILSMENSDHVYCIETRGRGVFLQSFPIDVSPVLKEKLYPKSHATLFTSATLSAGNNFAFIKSRLGIEEPEEHIIASPFDYENQAVFYIASDMPDPSSGDFTIKAAERMKALLTETKGRAFLLFTSYRNMEKVWNILSSDPNLPYMMLKQGDSPRSVIIEKFRQDTHSILFATSSFWQGVDVPGEALSAVIIDKLPFATPDDPQVAARIEALEKRGGKPFMEYQLPSAAIALKQGLGRLIRSKEDRGLLAVLDKRLATKSYGRVFLKSLPKFRVIRNLEEAKDATHKTLALQNI